jgi:hypothetical protein
MLVRGCANELNVDVDLVASLLDAAFQDVGDTKLTRNFGQIARPRGVLLRRIS